MIGRYYWTTGVVLRFGTIRDGAQEWKAELKFYDAGWCQDGSTEGALTLRYFTADIVAGVKTLLADARCLGIVGAETPLRLYVTDDGEGAPNDWRATARAVAAACGLYSIYAETP